MSLRESEARYRSLVGHAAVCIAELELDGRIISTNAAGLRILGVEDEHRLTGTSFVAHAAEGDRLRVQEGVARARAGYSTQLEFTTGDLERPLTLNASLIPMKGADGLVRRIVSVTQDVTDERRAHARLIEQEGLAYLGRTAVISPADCAYSASNLSDW